MIIIEEQNVFKNRVNRVIQRICRIFDSFESEAHEQVYRTLEQSISDDHINKWSRDTNKSKEKTFNLHSRGVYVKIERQKDYGSKFLVTIESSNTSSIVEAAVLCFDKYNCGNIRQLDYFYEKIRQNLLAKENAKNEDKAIRLLSGFNLSH